MGHLFCHPRNAKYSSPTLHFLSRPFVVSRSQHDTKRLRKSNKSHFGCCCDGVIFHIWCSSIHYTSWHPYSVLLKPQLPILLITDHRSQVDNSFTTLKEFNVLRTFVFINTVAIVLLFELENVFFTCKRKGWQVKFK